MTCETCGKVYMNKTKLYRHVYVVHRQKIKWLEWICWYTAKSLLTRSLMFDQTQSKLFLINKNQHSWHQLHALQRIVQMCFCHNPIIYNFLIWRISMCLKQELCHLIILLTFNDSSGSSSKPSSSHHIFHFPKVNA